MNNVLNLFLQRPRPLSLKGKILLTKRLSFLLDADVPLIESLSILRAQTTVGAQRSMLDSIVADVSNGQSLSASVSRSACIRDDFFINILRVGEQSGSLAENLRYLSEELRKKQILRQKIKSALAYPALICLSTIGITVVLLMYVFPKILPIFQSLRIPLPLSTRILVFVSDGLAKFGIYILMAVFVSLGIGVYFYYRNSAIRLRCDTSLLCVPFCAPFVRNYVMANACRALQLLLVSGMRLPDALASTGGLVTNTRYKAVFLCLSESVSGGESLAKGMSGFPRLFPTVAWQLTAVGERAGTLPKVFGYLSEMYEAEMDEQAKRFTNALEPVLMISMGLLVGFVALAIISPMYAITSHISPK